jgi:hypothetical protein
MQYIIDKETGKLIFAAGDSIVVDIVSNQLLVQQDEPVIFDNPYWDFDNNIFYNKID